MSILPCNKRYGPGYRNEETCRDCGFTVAEHSRSRAIPILTVPVETYSMKAFSDALVALRASLAMAPKCRERSLVETKIDEAEMWAQRIPSPFFAKAQER